MRKRYFRLLVLALLLGLGCGSAQAATAGPAGLGLVIGDTAGISFKYFFGRNLAMDAALGAPWGYYVGPGISVQGDVMYTGQVGTIEKGPLYLHIGAGLGLAQGYGWYGWHNGEVDVRVTSGAEFFFPRSHFSVFLDVVPVFILVNWPGAGLHVALGTRYYF